MNLNKYFDYAKSIGFSDIEFKVAKENSLSIGIFRGKVEKYQVAENETLSVRGIVGGKLVTGSTEDLSNINELLDQMAALAPRCEEVKETEFFAGSEKYARQKKCPDALLKTPVKDKIALLLDAEKKCFAYDSRIKETQIVRYVEETSSLKLVNSKGLNLSYSSTFGSIIVGVVAKSEKDTRTGMNYKAFSSLDEVNVDELVKKCCDEAINALDGEQCESKKYKALLNQSVAAQLIGFYLSNVSGDAKNKGKTLLKDMLDKQVASKKLTITEDPNTKKYPYVARTFDDEGVATYKKDIIKNGVLKTFLYDMEAAKAANLTSTGNGYGRSSINVSTNYLEIKPGKLSKEELAQKIQNGIYITGLQGTHAGLNALSGDFSLQSCGYLIENGKITTPVNLITVAGNLFDVVKDIVEVGSDSELIMGQMSCPSVYIKKIAVSGK